MNMEKMAKILETCFAYIKYYRRKIAIVVAALFCGCLVVTFFFTEENIGTSEAAMELELLTNNIRKYYQTRPDYWGLNTKNVLDKKMYPVNMLKDGKLVGYFGNLVLVGNGPDADVVMPGTRSFDIVYKGLNKKQCIGLASFKFDSKFWLGVTGITIFNSRYNQFFTWDDKINGLPISKNRAKDVCNADNSIIWHYEQ